MEKACSKCGATKPLDDFYKSPRGPLGRHSNCKDCVRNRYTGKERIREGAGKQCSRCGEVNPWEDYHENKMTKDGKHPWCRKCRTSYRASVFVDKIQAGNKLRYRRHRYEGGQWCRILVTKVKASAKAHGKQFELDRPFVEELFKSQNGRCYWSGIELDTRAPKRGWRLPSIDRIDSTKGYLKDNVVIASYALNVAKGAMPPEEFKTFLRTVAESVLSQESSTC